MSDFRARTIECDQCGVEWTLPRVSRRMLRRRATAAGWDVGPGLVADLCPPCAVQFGVKA